MSRTIAVTGASGFVGQRVVRALIDRGYRVRILQRAPSPVPHGAAAHVVDFADPRQLDAALAGAEALVHLAGRAHVRNESGDPYPHYRATNLVVSEAIAASARRGGLSQLVFASSLKVYGEAEHIGPMTVPAPTDAYGRSKLEAELAIATELAGSACRFTALRLPLVYGPGVKGNVRRLFDAVSSGRPLPMRGLTAPRSMLGLTNLVAVLDGVLAREWRGGVCIPSDMEDVAPETLVRRIGEALGRRPRLLRAPLTLLRVAGRAGDILSRWLPAPVTTADVRRLTMASQVDSAATWGAIGRTPPQNMTCELAETAQWYRAVSGRR